MNSKTSKESLRQRIHKKLIVEQEESDSATNNSSDIVDIEDVVVGGVKSEFFSPLQTRQQRKTSNKEFIIRELTNLKHFKSEDVKAAKVPNQEVIVNHSEIKEEPQIHAEVTEKVDKWVPKNWEVILNNIRKMRSDTVAPVDTMGCNKCSDESVDSKTRRFHVLVSLMLSSQTKDETTFAAMERLRTNSLTPETIVNMELAVLENSLKPVSFYKTKAKHLKLASGILIEKYDSDIPQSIAELIKLPGVGPKMAHLCMSEAWNEITGIGVDVHVHRISNRLNWLPKKTTKPEETRAALESWVPRSLWRDINHLLVGFGQTFCTPLRPKCSMCLNCSICPSAEIVTGKKSTKVKSEK